VPALRSFSSPVLTRVTFTTRQHLRTIRDPAYHPSRRATAPSTMEDEPTTTTVNVGIATAMVATSDALAPTVISAPLAMDTMNTIEVTDMDTTTVSRISLADTARMPITALSTTATEMHGISVEMGGITGVSAPIRHR